MTTRLIISVPDDMVAAAREAFHAGRATSVSEHVAAIEHYRQAATLSRGGVSVGYDRSVGVTGRGGVIGLTLDAGELIAVERGPRLTPTAEQETMIKSGVIW